VFQKISEITGPPRAERQGESSTGLQLGGRGSVATSTEGQARAWLLAQPSTAEADKALRTSLQSSLNVEVEIETRMMFPDQGKPYPVPSGSSVKATPETIDRAVSRLEAAMAPPAKDWAEEMLVILQAATTGGKRSAAGAAVALEVYAGALCRYPADVARDACMALATGKWFPTLGEIIEACERLVAPRRAMLTALQGWKPMTERERLEAEADDWYRKAWQADQDKFALKVRDPDAASEAAEFSPIAWAEYRRLSAEARAA
jgi:hypothetical protein